MGVWVQLRTVKQLEIGGKPKRFAPGDWVEVGKQAAMLWQADGSAFIPVKAEAQTVPTGCSVAIIGGDNRSQFTHMSLQLDNVQVSNAVVLLSPRTLNWEISYRVRMELVPVGFHLLEKWQVAAPLWSYTELARDVGGDKERQATEKVIRDMRVPLYDTRLLFLRRCAETEALLEKWATEQAAHNGDKRLSFLRALYQVKPIICALPAEWQA